ncbi:hypothetical protein NVP1206O_45 [Vibrio phage 1.206.O._10N.222.51.B10]|nr:hypothetical protein NVP1206O_45 [Vibrio phage 1.206.O._10N.222.51.B10]
MELSKYELSTLIRYCDDYRTNQERHIRRIRRNFDKIHELWEAWNDDGAIPSPQQDIDQYKENKAQAVIIKKKLIMQRERKQ